MITKELTTYITTQLSNGVTKEEVIATLRMNNNWTAEQLEEAFQAIRTPTVAAAVPEPRQKPLSAKAFTWLMTLSAALITFTAIYLFTLTTILVTPILLIAIAGITLLCVYRINYNKSRIARVILSTLYTFEICLALTIFLSSEDVSLLFPSLSDILPFYLFGGFMFFFYGFVYEIAMSPIVIITLTAAFILKILAMHFLAGSTTKNWLEAKTKTLEAGMLSKALGRTIFWANILYLILAAPLIFGLDLWILIDSGFSFEIKPIYYAMLIVFILSLPFLFYENFILKKKIISKKITCNQELMTLVILRNFFCVLNFIPFVQFIAGPMVLLGLLPYLFFYFFTVHKMKN